MDRDGIDRLLKQFAGEVVKAAKGSRYTVGSAKDYNYGISIKCPLLIDGKAVYYATADLHYSSVRTRHGRIQETELWAQCVSYDERGVLKGMVRPSMNLLTGDYSSISQAIVNWARNELKEFLHGGVKVPITPTQQMAETRKKLDAII